MEQLKAKDLAKVTGYALNSYSFDNKEYAETICREHRTLQQSWMRMVVATCKAMAEKGYDERNESAHRLAEAIKELAEDYPLPMI